MTRVKLVLVVREIGEDRALEDKAPGDKVPEDKAPVDPGGRDLAGKALADGDREDKEDKEDQEDKEDPGRDLEGLYPGPDLGVEGLVGLEVVPDLDLAGPGVSDLVAPGHPEWGEDPGWEEDPGWGEDLGWGEAPAGLGKADRPFLVLEDLEDPEDPEDPKELVSSRKEEGKEARRGRHHTVTAHNRMKQEEG
jgi:hypothetical protein